MEEPGKGLMYSTGSAYLKCWVDMIPGLLHYRCSGVWLIMDALSLSCSKIPEHHPEEAGLHVVNFVSNPTNRCSTKSLRYAEENAFFLSRSVQDDLRQL